MKDIFVVSDDRSAKLPFYKTGAFFFEEYGYEEYERFILAIEKLVRSDDRYSAYIHKLKSNGLDKCAFLGNIKGDKVSIEMHHGPMFGLYDICDVVTRALIKRKVDNLTTYMVADLVLTEHELDNIQIVMLTKTPHKGVDTNYMFIHTKMSFGRIDRFMDNWSEGILSGHKAKIEKYIEQCKEYSTSTDNGLLDTAKKLKFKK